MNAMRMGESRQLAASVAANSETNGTLSGRGRETPPS
jgi:hypothetical protein